MRSRLKFSRPAACSSAAARCVSCGRVDAAERARASAASKLCAPSDTRLTPAARYSAKRAALDGAGIGLQRDFGIRARAPACARAAASSLLDRARREQARRAAAEEHAARCAPRDRAAPAPSRSRPQARRGRLPAASSPLQGVGVEVAVGALAHAPGEVHVQRQRRGRRRVAMRLSAAAPGTSAIHSFTSCGRSICIMWPASASIATPRTSWYCWRSAPSGSSPCQASRSQSRSLPMKKNGAGFFIPRSAAAAPSAGPWRGTSSGRR